MRKVCVAMLSISFLFVLSCLNEVEEAAVAADSISRSDMDNPGTGTSGRIQPQSGASDEPEAATPSVYISTISTMSTEDWDVEVLAEGLIYPWEIAVIGNDIILTELIGNLVVLSDGQVERYRLNTSDPILQNGGSGLLGMVLGDDFARTGKAYFYHSYQTRSGMANRVITAVFTGSSWNETGVLIDGIPGHSLYNGGRMSLGRDGKLYVATGWAHEEGFAQNLDNLAGKILRLDVDGSVPADNPYPGSYVYSYGHRNPQGLE